MARQAAIQGSGRLGWPQDDEQFCRMRDGTCAQVVCSTPSLVLRGGGEDSGGRSAALAITNPTALLHPALMSAARKWGDSPEECLP